MTARRVIAASPDVVYGRVRQLDRMPELSPEAQRFEWLDGTPGDVGASFRGWNRTLGMRVAMVEKGPRYSTGARGLGSNKSRWLGPPPSQINRIDRAFGACAGAELPSRPGSPQAKGAAKAARTKARPGS